MGGGGLGGKAFRSYAAACVAAIAIIGGVAWAFVDPAGRRTLLASGCLALGVQLVSFSVTRLLQPRHLLLGWGLGSMLRLASLVLYAVIVAKVWRAPITPALLSYVGFLFVTTVFEPVFLKQ